MVCAVAAQYPLMITAIDLGVRFTDDATGRGLRYDEMKQRTAALANALKSQYKISAWFCARRVHRC